MPVEPFEKHAARYERWFEEHELAYRSELEAVRWMLPRSGRGLEVGVGSARFAAPLGITIGVDPSLALGRIARQRGVRVVAAVGENLPFKSESFDFVLMVTTLCFLDDVARAFAEVFRVLKQGGVFVNGFVDRESTLGRLYQRRKDQSVFYRAATFFSVAEAAQEMRRAGFRNPRFCQTLFSLPSELRAVEQPRAGFGEGAFVVISATKPRRTRWDDAPAVRMTSEGR